MMQALAEAVDCEASARNALALRPPDFARARALCQESRRHLLRFSLRIVLSRQLHYMGLMLRIPIWPALWQTGCG